MKRFNIGLTAASLLWAMPAAAAVQTLVLAPRSAQIGFRAYGMGIVPLDGAFTRFTGSLVLDAADPSVCTVTIDAEAASLEMPDADMTRDAIGVDLLHAAAHPAFTFNGRCEGKQVRGTLLLHGVSRPLALDVTIEQGQWVATGRMRRAEWGMTARAVQVGSEIRIRFVAALPAGFPARP